MRKNILITTILTIAVILGSTFTVLHGQELMPLAVDVYDLSPVAKKEVECLADNIYFESGAESKAGKIAVGLVTMNRVKHGFENSVCGVVKQKTNSTCQFSWWCEAKAKSIALHKERYLSDKQWELYNEIRDIALYVYMNHEIIKDNTKGALYYHANYVNPQWKLKKTVTIGNHIFYSPY